MGQKGKKRSQWKDLLLYIYKGIGVLLCTLLFSFFCVLPLVNSIRETILLLLLFCCAYMLFGKVYKAFHVGRERVSNLIFSKALSLLLVYAGMYAILWGMVKRPPSALRWVLVFVVTIFLGGLWAIVGNRLYLRLYPPARAALIYRERRNLDIFLSANNPKLFSVEKVVHADELAGTMQPLEDVEVVFLCDLPLNLQRRVLKYSSFHNLQVYLRPRISDVLLNGAKQVYMFDLPMLAYGPDKTALGYDMGKRAFDIVFSAILLVASAPLMLFAAIAVKAYDGGPALYRQTRLTRDGKEFSILKFRSMRADAERDGKARLASVGDTRITPIGRLIRSTRIDELPQLVNIMRGEMSVVGPRPERPEVARQYAETLPEFHLRLQVKAGLTGFAQVYGKYNTEPYEKLQMDLMYIAKRSLFEDIKLLFLTIKVVFLKDSTQGVANGATTAMGQKVAGATQEILPEDNYTAV